MQLQHKIALITGGSSGIGLALAKRMVQGGASVALVARGTDKLEAAAESLRSEPSVRSGTSRVLTIAADVGDRAALDRLPQTVVEALGGLDILVNNAGVNYRGLAMGVTPAQLAQVIDVNLTAPVYLSRRALDVLRPGGAIIQISSLAGKVPFAEQATYSASKSGLRFFSRALGEELAARNIHVLCVNPGPVDTDFFQDVRKASDITFSQPMSTVEEVAEATLRAYAHPPLSRTLSVFTFPDPDTAAALTTRILDQRFGPTALDIFSSAEGAYIVLARLEGEPEAVDALAASIDSLAHEIPWLRVQVAETTASQELWRAAGTGGAYWNGPQVNYAVTVRVGVPIASVGPLLADVRDITDRFDVPRLVTMHAGAGAGYVHLGALRNQTTVDALAAAALALRAAAEAHGGHAILAAGPPQVKARVPVWGATAAPDLMAEIKRQFDPTDTLNPGRFVV